MFFFERGTAVPFAEAKPCISWKKRVFVTFPRGMAVPLSRMHNRVSRGKKRAIRGRNKNRKPIFFVFERRGHASHESKTAPFAEAKP